MGADLLAFVHFLWPACSQCCLHDIVSRMCGPVPNPSREGEIMAKTPAKRAANKVPDKITSASMIEYLAEKNGLVRKNVKQVLEDLFEIIGAGVMRGERVALGKMGKMFIRVRPARAAHMGRNPLTGQEIKIPAKPARKVPRLVFSKTFKEAVLKAKAKK